MKIEVNIKKSHFVIILSTFLILALLGVTYAFGGNTPRIVGHSIGEIDWSEIIPSSIKVGGDISLWNQKVLSFNDNAESIHIGDFTDGDIDNRLILSAGGKETIVIEPTGSVVIGKDAISSVGISGDLDVGRGGNFIGSLSTQGTVRAKGLTLYNTITAQNQEPTKTITYQSGNNPGCIGAGKEVFLKKWTAKTCTGSQSTCNTIAGWDGVSPPTCKYVSSSIEQTCTATAWTEVLCIERDDVLQAKLP